MFIINNEEVYVKNCSDCGKNLHQLDYYQLYGNVMFYFVWCADGCGFVGPTAFEAKDAIRLWNEISSNS